MSVANVVGKRQFRLSPSVVRGRLAELVCTTFSLLMKWQDRLEFVGSTAVRRYPCLKRFK